MINSDNDILTYKFYIEGQVKFHEVDSFRVVHNIQYLYYLEWVRINYMMEVGFPIDNKSFSENNLMMVVHQTIDYFNPLFFLDIYKVFCKTTNIGNSSMTVENIITKSDQLIAKAKAVMVYIDEKTKKPTVIPSDIRQKIYEYESIGIE